MCQFSSCLHTVKKLWDCFFKTLNLKLMICLRVSAKGTSQTCPKTFAFQSPSQHSWQDCVTKTAHSHLLQHTLLESTQIKEQGKIRKIPCQRFYCMTSILDEITSFLLAVPQKLFSPHIFNKNQTPNSKQRSISWNRLTTDQESHSLLHDYEHEKKNIYPFFTFHLDQLCHRRGKQKTSYAVVSKGGLLGDNINC